MVRLFQVAVPLTCPLTPLFQSALLAVLAGQLLVFVKDSTNFTTTPSPNAHKFLMLISYSAIVFNSSATVASLVLTDRLGELPVRAARMSESEKESHHRKSTKDSDRTFVAQESDPEGGRTMDESSTSESSTQLLVKYGAGELWIWAVVHCKSTSHAFLSVLVWAGR